MTDADPMAALRETAMQGVAKIASTFKKPEADFMPAFIYLDGAGNASIVGLRTKAENDEEENRLKNQAAGYIERTLRRDRAQAASLMLSVWTATPPVGTTLEEARSGKFKASKMPNRKEVLWLQLTDGRQYEVWQADLIRHQGSPPTIGEWQMIPDAEASEGRFQMHRIFRRALGLSSHG